MNDNLTFRFKRFPLDYSAFNGRDLSPKGWIELNPDSSFCELPVSVEDKSNSGNLPERFQLYQNYPNPFNPFTTISYSLISDGFVKLTVYDILGNVVKILIDEQQKPGTYDVKFDATELPTGVYFYKLISGNLIRTKKMMLIK